MGTLEAVQISVAALPGWAASQRRGAVTLCRRRSELKTSGASALTKPFRREVHHWHHRHQAAVSPAHPAPRGEPDTVEIHTQVAEIGVVEDHIPVLMPYGPAIRGDDAAVTAYRRIGDISVLGEMER